MSLIRKLSLYTIVMLAIPLVVWATGWQWQGDENVIFALDYPLFWLTETGSAPYALITCVVLMLWLMGLTRRHFSWLLVGVVCATSVIGTQAVKSGAKFVFAEPRPYVVQMMGEQTEQFYELSRDERSVLVNERYKGSEYPLIVSHRAHETGYSFPSGHTIFAVSWLLLFAGLLNNVQSRGAVLAKIVVLFWSAMMLISRLRLGMHYPIDLFVSTLLAWGFHIVLFLGIVPRLVKLPLFQRRG
ncbi:phosphatidylglycerophosphatase [Pasteurellaceae bacterium Macca]|nr:phosphatidylglycerophosphatase [Pasteurellaceae bacterium Macca]